MFITFEGPDGSGKTTQIIELATFLENAGHKVLTTREPGGTAIGNQIRQVLFDLGNTAMHPRTEILLFQSSRAQLVEQVIKPHLADGYLVLCDRYADSTMAYQGYGHQNDLNQIQSLINFATGGLKPELTLLLDIEVEEGLQRKVRGREWNRLDAYSLEFHQRVRDGYHHMAAAEPERWVTIDAEQPANLVQEAMRQVIRDRLMKTEAP